MFLEEYQQELSKLKNIRQNTLSAVVALFKQHGNKPITIGNMVYYYIIYNGQCVPSYCYVSDYVNGADFLPIYDEFQTGDFGWQNFAECCRIFDVIVKRLKEK